MGLVVMARDWFDRGGPDEFDVCTLCGRQTTLLISFRVVDILANVCGICIDDQKKGYDYMMSRRMQFDLSSKDETS
jgi:hypothetical protein